MTEDDKKNFQVMMNIVMANFGRKPLDKEALRFWFGKLEKQDLQAVSHAFDTWIDTQSELPTIHDIALLCKPKVTIHQRLSSPLRLDENRKHMEEVKVQIGKMTKPKTDMKGWARKIMANPSAYPDISFKFAREALGSE